MSHDLLPFLTGAFGAGLFALVTPCVFPMIPITLAFFTKQATAKDDSGVVNQGAVVRLAAVYSLGIILSFTLLGGVTAATLGATGAGDIASNPWLNIAFAALFIIFGLALLEIFEIRLPSKLQNLAGNGRNASGILGVLGLGFTFVIAAFTCTAPFIGAVLVTAAQAKSSGDWLRPILGMVTFATALAMPFFVLSLFPALLAKLPKSGSWLTTVKGAMGFIELAAALKFLSNADLSLGTNLLTRSLMLALTGLFFIAGAFWLLGRLQIGWSTPNTKPSPMRGFWAVAYGFVGLYMLYGLTGKPLIGQLSGYFPPESLFASKSFMADRNRNNDATHNGESPEFVNDLAGAQAEAKRSGKLIFVDFTAINCGNCRAMEQNVFPKPQVRDKLKNFVRLVLWTDGYNPAKKKGNLRDGRPWKKIQQDEYGTVELPLYGILDSTGKPVKTNAKEPFRFAYDENAQKFADFLTQAQEAGQPKVARN